MEQPDSHKAADVRAKAAGKTKQPEVDKSNEPAEYPNQDVKRK